MKTTIIRHQIYRDSMSIDHVIVASVGRERFFWLQSFSSERPEASFSVEIGRPEALSYIEEASRSGEHSFSVES